MTDDDWSEREIDRGTALDREVDRLRGVYRDHAETLSKLAASAPSKRLARRYQELISEINKSIVGLDEVEPGAIARTTGETPAPLPASEKPTRELPLLAPDAPLSAPPKPPPAERPILSTYTASAPPEESEQGALLRIVFIVVLAVVLIAVLGLFVWKYSGDRPASTDSAAPPAATAPPPAEEPVAPAPEPKPVRLSHLTVSPQQQDFGTVAKGTSVVRTFEISNSGKRALTLEIARSKCRCLWYDPPKSIPAGGRGTLTVRVDGEKAPAGLLAESIEISGKGDPEATAVLEITADVK